MNNTDDQIVIVSACRTPMGGFQGELSGVAAPELGAVALKGAIQRGGIAPERVDQVLMGCVLPAGLGQSPTRQAAIGAGLPFSTSCSGIAKVCGSGMQAVILGHDQLRAGSHEVVLAGGMESMTNAPYLLPKARGGYRMGHGQILDHMLLDGLEDAYSAETRGRHMGTFAEDCASHYGFTREQQDEFALMSTTRARQSVGDGSFAWEIAGITITTKGTERLVDKDEAPFKAQPEKIPLLKPAFRKGGTVTAANASSISDGAAALLLMRASTATQLGLRPLATIRAHASHSHEPALFNTAPVGAIRKLLPKAGWRLDDVDLFEINEAFAVTVLAAMRELDISHAKINVHGGACALGHPIGASGARILVTLLGALRARNQKRGIATLCIGGGEATAVAVELC